MSTLSASGNPSKTTGQANKERKEDEYGMEQIEQTGRAIGKVHEVSRKQAGRTGQERAKQGSGSRASSTKRNGQGRTEQTAGHTEEADRLIG
jgi:hypothetical protein